MESLLVSFFSFSSLLWFSLVGGWVDEGWVTMFGWMDGHIDGWLLGHGWWLEFTLLGFTNKKKRLLRWHLH